MLLALDLGTTGVRAALVDAQGAVRGLEYRPLETRYPAPGCVEQDPRALWVLSLEVMREALREAGVDARRVAGLGVVTQRATIVAWDARSGEALCPAIGWQDRRTAARVEELRALGLAITTLPSATKFEWWLQRDDAVRAAAADGRLRLGTPDVWLTDRLTGGTAHVTDPGQASCTGLLDLSGGDWNPEALALFGIDAGFLPRVVPTCGVVGETPPDLLGAPVAVAARAGDQQAASFAQSVLAPGDAKLTLGTAAILDVHTGDRPAEIAAGAFPITLWRIADSDSFAREGTVITAGAVVDWLVAVGLLASPAHLDRVAGSVESAAGVELVPALEGLGTPLLDTAARGLVGGLTRGSRAAHVVRAALDGIAHRCVDTMDALALDERAIRVDGGLARSDRLLQRIADLAGRPLLRAAETETTALGGALLAGLATGWFESPRACGRLCDDPQRFDPNGAPEARARERSRWRTVVERARGGAADA